VLFPELRPSDRWRRQGRGLLLEGLERQVFPDGGYVQHSANYHRLALGLAVWSARLAELNGEPLPPSTLTVIGRMARALAVQADPESGGTPAFGPDDGSDVLPLASAERGDVRPIVAAASRLALGETWYPPGPWDEASSWLGLGPGVRRDPPHDDDLMDAGLHYLRGAEARAGLRCVRFHERPGHSDQLHVDLSYRGRPLVLDPGSYLYNGPPPWDDGLATAFVHNAPIIDGREAMRRAGRFLWVDRAQGTFESRSRHDGVQQMRASHDGYRRIGVHLIRTVSQVEEGAWLVSDVARAPDATAHRLTVGWNLPDQAWEWLPGELRLAGADGGPWIGWDAPSAGSVRAGLVRAGRWVAGEQIDGPSDVWGWASPRYATIEPCLRLVLEITGNSPLCMRTRVAPSGRWPDRLLRIWDAPDAAGAAAP
jgi:hypothetical protein